MFCTHNPTKKIDGANLLKDPKETVEILICRVLCRLNSLLEIRIFLKILKKNTIVLCRTTFFSVCNLQNLTVHFSESPGSCSSTGKVRIGDALQRTEFTFIRKLAVGQLVKGSFLYYTQGLS